MRCSEQRNLLKFFMDLQEYFLLFYALTWRKNSNNNFNNLSQMPKNTLLHVTARGKTKNDIKEILNKALELGICNIFALRGDSECTTGDFLYAVDLVKFIKKNYNDKFSIAVAGYPDRHPESVTKESEFFYLKEKVDAGADFIITQIIYDSKAFINFVKDCQENGIAVPILAGVMPIINYSSLMKTINVCGLKIPESVHKNLEKIKQDDLVVHQYGVKLIIEIITDIMDHGFYGFHFFTFNKSETVLEILNKLNFHLNK
ncbi:methylenetetrahydrofolate reductase (NADPH) [Cotesia typhae]|uniref:methylenetetrahydrofolate reductase (NADPH) n=1 Tax=Cotesia typhae TaxID=2053667 RepID=UPI003D68B981